MRLPRWLNPPVLMETRMCITRRGILERFSEISGVVEEKEIYRGHNIS